MNCGEIIDQVRNITMDNVEGNILCLDEELMQYLNEAQMLASRNAKLQKTNSLSFGETLASATITVAGSSGSISQILIDNVNIITNNIVYTSTDNVTAQLISNEINSTGLFNSTVVTNTVTIHPLEGNGSYFNNLSPIIIATQVFANSTPFLGGVDGPCRIQLKPNVKEYKFSPKILKIENITLGVNECHLSTIDYRNLSETSKVYYKQKGSPEKVFYGMSNDSFTVGKIPDKKDFLNLTVYHLPLNKLKKKSDIPEIPEQFHANLIDYILYKFYLKADVEIDGIQLSAKYRTDFEREFQDSQFSAASNQFNLYFFFSDENEYR